MDKDDHPRVGGALFRGAPLVDLPLAAAYAAHALGTFGVGELAGCLGTTEAEARALLDGMGADVARSTAPAMAGGMREVWRSSPEAQTAHSAWLEAHSPRDIHRMLHGDWRETVVRLDAMDRASTYLDMAGDCDGDDRKECLDWAGLWLKAARSALDGHEAVGSDVAPGLRSALDRMNGILAGLAR